MTENQQRSAYRPHKRKTVVFDGLSMTKTSFKDECDVNNIMAKFRTQGVLDHVRHTKGQYGDFTSAPEYHKAMNEILKAEEMFATVPAHIRKKFDNSAEKFLSFVQDKENYDEMKKLGLVDVQLDIELAIPEKDSPKTTEKSSKKAPDAETV